MKQMSGFLLDVYAHPKAGVILWVLGDDGIRRSFTQDFETIFYVRGPFPRLRALWIFLRDSRQPVHLAKVERDDLYEGRQEVMEVRLPSPTMHTKIFQAVQAAFPDLIYYDVDTALPLRYAATFNVFPLAHCDIQVENNKVMHIEAMDSPWDIDPPRPALRKLKIKPNVDPFHAEPTHLIINYEKFKYHVELNKPRELLQLLNAILRQYNPDVILTRFGDTWLFPYLAQLSRDLRIPFQPNRDLSRDVIRKKQISFFNYGRAHLRGPQIHLLGRWHIDVMNCMNYSEYGLEGTLEMARITGMPVQEIARRSAGAGISAMQVLTAMRRGVMIPFQRQKGEVYKTYNQLFEGDSGGLIAEPELGIFENVAILDFTMMYPSLIVQYNLSPETVAVQDTEAWEVPGLGVRIASQLGLIPETLKPMVDKRITLKRMLKTMDPADPRWRRYMARTDTMKKLGIVFNGRMGFANSIFGRINAFETISYIGRKIVLQAKEIAEEHGFTVLHMYVDSLFLCKEGVTQPGEFRAVMDEIEAITKLPIDIEEVYSWVAFVSSRRDSDVPVSNRFFCRKPNGDLKVRGLAQRRRDTCVFVKNVQNQAVNVLGQERDLKRLVHLLGQVVEAVREGCAALKAGRIPLEQLVVTQTLSRELNEYKATSAQRTAAAQLEASGKVMHMGQVVRYVHTCGKPGAYAWDLPVPPRLNMINVQHYQELVIRAIYEVVQPLGVPEDLLRSWILGEASYIDVGDFAKVQNRQFDSALPLFASLNSLEKRLIQIV